MKKIIKSIFLIIFATVAISLFSKVEAASATISANKTTATVGDSVKVTLKINAAAWNINVSGSASDSVVGFNSDAENQTTKKTYSINTSKAGTYSVSISGDITDASSTTPEKLSKSVTITVKAKSTSGSNSGSGNNTGGSTTKPSTPTEKYTDVNEKVYSTTDGLNVRKSANGAIIGSLSKGDEVTRTGIGNQGWSRIKLSNGTTAYVSSSYLTKTKPAEDKPKTEEPKKNTTTNEEVNNTTSEGNNETKNNEVGNNNTGENTTTTDESLGLSSLEIAGVNFSDGFDPSKHIYGLKLNFFVKNLDITAKANKEDAKIEIIGNQDFVEGENNVTILLTSADGKETATYQIKVTVPSEIATAPQNNIQFYIMCGSIIITAIVLIAIVTAIYRKVSNKSSDSREENEKLFENPYVDDKPKKEKSKGKHSN
mgnify:FL=1|jgi:hypothetical protein